MLQFDEYRIRLNDLKPELDELGRALQLNFFPQRQRRRCGNGR